MNARETERRLDTLTRAELRTLGAELVGWLGYDAATQLCDRAAMEPVGRQAQLPFGAADLRALGAALADLVAADLGAVRGVAAGVLTPAQAATIVDAVADGFGRVAAAAAEALRFELRDGVEFVVEVFEAAARPARARAAFGGEVACPAPSFEALDAALAEVAATCAFDEPTFGRLVDAAVAATGQVPDAWRWVAAAVCGRTSDAAAWALRRLERAPRAPYAPQLLRVVADATGAESPDGLLQVAELHIDAGPEVIDLIVETRLRHEQRHEARFWVHEGRRRYPRFGGWDKREEEAG